MHHIFVEMSGFAVVPTVGALAGSALAASYTSGAPVMDLLTSVSGAAGAAIGYVAGQYAANAMSSKVGATSSTTLRKALPAIGAMVIPGLASGAWDKETFALGMGAYAGAEVLVWACNKYL